MKLNEFKEYRRNKLNQWRRQANILNEAHEYEAFIGNIGINRGSDLTQIYPKYIFSGNAEHDNSNEVKLLARQLRRFWESVWQSDHSHMFQCKIIHLDKSDSVNYINQHAELNQFDKQFGLYVVQDDGGLNKSYDDWRRFIEEFFETTTSKKFGFTVDFIFPKENETENNWSAFSTSITVTNPSLLAKLVDPNPSSNAANGAAPVQKKQKFDNGDDIAQLLKQKAISLDCRNAFRRAVEEVVNPATMKSPEYSQQSQVKIMNDPNVTSAIMLVINTINAHGKDAEASACDYAKQVFLDKVGLEVEFDVGVSGSIKPATSIKVVDVGKFYSKVNESQRCKYSKKQILEAIEYWNAKLVQLDVADQKWFS